MEVKVIRSKRKTMSMEMNLDGTLLIRAPYTAADAEIQTFLKKQERWIEKTSQEMYERRQREASMKRNWTEEERRQGIDRAVRKIPERVAYYADKMQISYGRITIREQKTRWGSCSTKGNLNFNWKLALMPEEILDYVVVHELCHRLEMNHSKCFWKLVEEQMPDYEARRRWLNDNGWKY